ncbi:hypothetical protein [Nocardia wallacei]|uniref:hypothetical protein n=1 Tax=Nocardia wallacei TaxID=480035 RepID=UPI002453EF9F|nr:hypothetical protein [Nocardia wallacei]
MRDFMGTHVSQVNEYGSQIDVDGVFASVCVRGSFAVRYAKNVDKVIVAVGSDPCSEMRLQLSLDEANLLRELLDAGIADALAATVVELELPAGGDAA